MADDRKYLIGKGENLTEDVRLATGFGDKKHPYKFTEAKRRLEPKLVQAAKIIRNLPDSACPNDEAVAILTLHPSYLAKSYFPEELLGGIGLRSLGSRGTRIRPEKVTGARQQGKELVTVELYAAGKRSYFDRWAKDVLTWTEVRPGAEQLRNSKPFMLKLLTRGCRRQQLIKTENGLRPLFTSNPLKTVSSLPSKSLSESTKAK